MSDPRRWRLIHCFTNDSENSRLVDAREEIAWIESKGFKAKIWAPLPQHKTSGHTHVVALCTLEEKLFIGGVPLEEVSE